MFRKKENDPVRPAAPADAGVARSPLEVRSPLPPELPKRQVEIPTAPSAIGAAERTPIEPARGPMVVKDDAGKRLIVGQGISLSGEITACDRLVVEGSVQVTLNQTRAIEITESGRFTNGKAEVEEAEISGIYEGELTVRNRLLIRSTGQVKGTVRYGELQIERGGRLSGTVSMLDGSSS